MNIGIVCYPTYGGSGVVATELGKALALKGHQIHFISYNQPVKLDTFTENIQYHQVNVSEYPLFEYPPYELVLASKLVDVVRHEKLDLLHVHYAIPHASAAYMAQKILEEEGISIPFITTLHGTDITLVGKDSSFEPVISFAINKSNAVTAVSESLKQDTFKHFNTNRAIQVIPNFVCMAECEPPKLDEDLKQKIAPYGEKIMVHVSNFRKVKRIQDVVKIFRRVREQMPVKLLLIGDGPELQNAEFSCRTAGIEKDLMILGKVNDVDRVVGIADLFLLPSEFESFGLAALEAMSVGVPVISSNTGGLPEVNLDGFSGYTSPVGDVESMSLKAIELLSDNDQLHRFKENAFGQAKKFDILNILPQYEMLYKSVLQ